MINLNVLERDVIENEREKNTYMTLLVEDVAELIDRVRVAEARDEHFTGRINQILSTQVTTDNSNRKD